MMIFLAECFVLTLSLLHLTRYCGPKPERGYELGVKTMMSIVSCAEVINANAMKQQRKGRLT